MARVTGYCPKSRPPTSYLYCQGGAGYSPHSFILFLKSGAQFTTLSAFPPPWKEEQGTVREEPSPARMPLSQEGAELYRSEDACRFSVTPV